ncbi:hypothetical protein PHMEG_00040737, partial [Phytophthora megakarya]
MYNELYITETPQRKGKKKRALAPKKTSAVLEWTDAMVLDLMTLRYETHADRFSYAKNNAALKAAWLLLATELSDNQEMPISSEQCKNKLKWLRRKWAEYNADVRATGNAETEIVDPPGLALMQKFWSGSAGMNGQTLADSEADSVAILSDEEACCGGDADGNTPVNRQGREKKRKTLADSFETGMQSLANGFQAMAAAMVQPTVSSDNSVSELIDSRFQLLMQ